MNERIKELLIEAREQTKEGKWNAPTAVWAEKFAQLIVKECMYVAGPEDSFRDAWFGAKADSVEMIKRHFGVQE